MIELKAHWILSVLLLAGFPACLLAAAEDSTHTIAAADYHVGRTTSGTRTTTEIDLRADNRTWVKFPTNHAGDWLQFHLPTLRPGRYAVALRVVDYPASPACDVEMGEADGSGRETVGVVPAGTDTTHAHWTAFGFRVIELGEVAIDRPGFRTLRLTARAPQRPDGWIGVTTIILKGIVDPALTAPIDLQLRTQGTLHCDLVWRSATRGESGFLIERQGPPQSGWQPCGYVPPGVHRFVATGMYPNSAYDYRVRAWSKRGLGPPSTSNQITTGPVMETWLGQRIQPQGGSRNGEGSVVRLRDGRMLMYYNAQQRTDDFAPFEIFQTESADQGLNWTNGTPLLTDPAGQTGYMMPSLLRLTDGRLAFSYARRENRTLVAHRVFRISNDEGQNWSKETVITTDLPLSYSGYTFTGATGPHDRLIQAANGDLFIPFHLTTGGGTQDVDPYHDQSGQLLISATVVYRSTDQGQTWRRVFGPVLIKGTLQTAPYAYQWIDQLLSEPGLVETAPGHLLLHMRNPSGFFYQAKSTDHGDTWTPVHQSPINAPISPAKLLNVAPGIIAMAFNPWVDPHAGNLGRRFALGTLISRDEGQTWENFKLIDASDPAVRPANFCYPYFLNDGTALHAFYFGGRGLDMTYRRLPADWFLTPP